MAYRKKAMPSVRLGALLLVLAGCSHSVDGPQPVLTAVSPNSACAEGKSTLMSVLGSGLVPIEEGVLGPGKLDLPVLTLQRAMDLDGVATGEEVPVPSDPAASDEQWVNAMSLAVTLCPPGVCSAQTPPKPDFPSLPTGLYGIAVHNRTGAAAALPAALVLVPAPVFATLAPSSMSRAAVTEVVLTGDFFLRLNNKLPTVTVGDKSLTPGSLEDCRKLPAPAGVTLEACKRVLMTLPGNTFAPGTLAITVTGPTPVDCGSATQILTVTP